MLYFGDFYIGDIFINETGYTKEPQKLSNPRFGVKVKSLSRVQLCNPMDCSLPGSCIHGILQARVLEWVAISFSRGLPNSGTKPRSPTLWTDALPSEPPGKPIITESVVHKFQVTELDHRPSKMESILLCFFILIKRVFFLSNSHIFSPSNW